MGEIENNAYSIHILHQLQGTDVLPEASWSRLDKVLIHLMLLDGCVGIFKMNEAGKYI